MIRILCFAFLSILLISCNNTASVDKVQTAIAETQAAQLILEEKIQTGIANTQAAKPTLPATDTPLPATQVIEPTDPVIEPTATPTATAIPLPTTTPTPSAINLAICKPDTTGLCILFFGESNASLLITLKQEMSFTGPYHMILNSREFTCTIYNDATRLYCTGPMQPSNQKLYAELYADSPKILLAFGDIVIPAWPTPTPKTKESDPAVYP